jgi:hypothetical protein
MVGVELRAGRRIAHGFRSGLKRNAVFARVGCCFLGIPFEVIIETQSSPPQEKFARLAPFLTYRQVLALDLFFLPAFLFDADAFRPVFFAAFLLGPQHAVFQISRGLCALLGSHLYPSLLRAAASQFANCFRQSFLRKFIAHLSPVYPNEQDSAGLARTIGNQKMTQDPIELTRAQRGHCLGYGEPCGTHPEDNEEHAFGMKKGGRHQGALQPFFEIATHFTGGGEGMEAAACNRAETNK